MQDIKVKFMNETLQNRSSLFGETQLLIDDQNNKAIEIKSKIEDQQESIYIPI